VLSVPGRKLPPPPQSLRLDREAEHWLELIVGLFSKDGGIRGDVLDEASIDHNRLKNVGSATGDNGNLHVSQVEWDSLSARVTALIGTVDALNARLNAQDAALQDIRTRLADLENMTADHETRLNNIDTAIAALQADMQAAKDKLDDHEQRLQAGGL